MSEVVDPVRLPLRSVGSVPLPGPAPRPVRAAVVLLWVVVGINVVQGAWTLLGPGLHAALDQSLGQPVPGRPAQGPGLHTFVVIAAVIVGLVFLTAIAVNVVMAFQLRAGRTWPRTVLLVFTVLSAFSLASALVRAAVEPVSAVMNVVNLGVHVAVVVLLFGAVSRAWLVAHKAVRVDARRMW